MKRFVSVIKSINPRRLVIGSILFAFMIVVPVFAANFAAFEPENGMKVGNVSFFADSSAAQNSALRFDAPPVVSYGNDKWLFVGDSISVMSIDNSIATGIHTIDASRNPTIINVAIGGTSAATWADTDSAGGSISGVLASSDARFVPLALGTNDYQPVFKDNYEKLIQAVIAAGRIPVLPYMPWGNGQVGGKESLVNADIESLLAKYPQAVRGPNLYAATLNKPNLFNTNDVHPNSAGQEVIRQAWIQMMISLQANSDPYATIASNFDKSQWLVTGEAIPGSSASEPSGNFRTGCGSSHYAYDDPIVYPGQQGVSHLHNFYGNSSTNYLSTYALLRSSGNSTCQGGPLNRSGYWVPAVFNTSGKVVVPSNITVYYKGNGSQAEIQSIRTNPNGLRMIAGYDMANPTAPSYTWAVWECVNESTGAVVSNQSNTMPSCAADLSAVVEIRFPMCWNGKDLDSTNHRSHMAYGTGGGGWVTVQSACPSTHPIHLPEFTLKIHYPSDGNSANWYLSSDRMPGMAVKPNGTTFHADWFGAWDNEIQETWTQKCIREMRNCVFGQLGDGRRLKDEPSHYTGPSVIDPPVKP